MAKKKEKNKDKIMRLLGDILSPIRFAGGGIIQAPILAATGGKTNVPFLTPNELEKMSGNTFLDRLGKTANRGTKEVLEASSYAVPFGKGANALSKVLLPGAGVGLLQGLSADKVTPGGVARSTAGGAVGAGLLQGGANLAGKAVGGLTKSVPNRLMNSLFKETVGGTKSSIKQGATLGQEALQRGIKGKNATSIYGQAVAKMEAFEDAITGAIQPSKRIIPIADIKKTITPLIKKYSDAGDLSAVKNITDRITNLEAQHGKSIPLQVAQEVKRTLYEELSGGYGTLKNAEKEGLKTIARSLKEGIASKIKSVDVNKINKELSVYGRLRDSMLDKMTREERNNVMGLTDAILAGGGALGALTTGGTSLLPLLLKKTLGSTAGKTGIANTLSGVGEVLPKGGGQLMDTLLGQGGARMGAGLTTQVFQNGNQSNNPQENNQSGNANEHTTDSIPQEGEIATEQMVTDDNGNNFIRRADGVLLSEDKQWIFDEQAQDWVQNTEQQEQADSGVSNDVLSQLLQQALLSGNKKQLDLVKGYIEGQKSLIPEEEKKKPLSSASQTSLNLAKSGQRALKKVKDILLDQNGEVKDTNILTKQLVPGQFFSREFDSAVTRMIEALLRARSGAAVPDSEVKRYKEKFGPSFGDDADTIKFKLDQFEKDYNDVIEGVNNSSSQDDLLQQLLQQGSY